MLIEELQRLGGHPIYYGGYWGLVIFENIDKKRQKKEYTYELCYHHGWGGSPKSGTKISLNDLRLHVRADMYWIGHKHQTAVYSHEIYERRGSYLVRRPQWLISTGTYHSNPQNYQQSYTSYAERKGWLTTSHNPYLILRFINGKPHFEIPSS